MLLSFLQIFFWNTADSSILPILPPLQAFLHTKEILQFFVELAYY